MAEFIDDDEVEAGEIVGDLFFSSSPVFGPKPIDEIDAGEEAAAGQQHWLLWGS
jgi:hypothetical protein